MALIRLNRVTVSNRPVPGFLPDFLTTGLYRVVDYVKIVGNLAVRRPTQDKSQGLQFSRRQAVNGGIYFTFA